jgi:hypothetical protein
LTIFLYNSQRILGLVSLALLIFFAPGLLFAEETSIRNVFVTNSPTHLQLQFHLTNSFNEKMDEAINTGIPTVFDYYVELYQSRGFWNDRLLSSLVITKTIKYDTLKQEYVVTKKTNLNGASTQVMGSFAEAKQFMNNVNISGFYPMSKLERTKSYYFRIRARSQGIAPPGYVHSVLFFVNWMNFQTDWVIERFYY